LIVCSVRAADDTASKQAYSAWTVDINSAALGDEFSQYKQVAPPTAEVAQRNQRGTVKSKSREKRRASKSDIVTSKFSLMIICFSHEIGYAWPSLLHVCLLNLSKCYVNVIFRQT
jgi:hypothetical protein